MIPVRLRSARPSIIATVHHRRVPDGRSGSFLFNLDPVNFPECWQTFNQPVSQAEQAADMPLQYRSPFSHS